MEYRNTEKKLLVDGRWTGNSGIGRYSRELISRIFHDTVFLLDRGNPVGKLNLFLSFFRFIRFDIFYSPGYVAFFGARMQLITIHDLILLNHLIRNTHHRIYFNMILRPRIRQGKIRILTVSLYSQEVLSKWAGIPVGEIGLVPNGISKEILDAGNFVNSNHRGRSLIFVGNNKPHKRFDLFTAAVNLLDSPCSITLVGTGLSGENISDRHSVKVIKNVSDEILARLYLESNIVVVTSIYEGFCMPVLEGSYLGCKVVHLGVLPTIHEILGESTFSSLGSLEPLEIARVIEHAFDSPGKITDAQRFELAEKYDWDSSGIILRKILQKFIDENQRDRREFP